MIQLQSNCFLGNAELENVQKALDLKPLVP